MEVGGRTDKDGRTDEDGQMTFTFFLLLFFRIKREYALKSVYYTLS